MALPWPPPSTPDFSNGVTAIFATGPSLTQEQIDYCHGRVAHAIAVNDAFRLAPWADVLYACDSMWWNHPENIDTLDFRGLRVTQDIDTFGNVYRVEESGKDGFDPEPGKLRTGSNSGYQATHLAAQWGARDIILLGFDMGVRDGRAHFFGDHPPGLTKQSPYASFISIFRTLAPPLQELGCRVTNCTPKSGLDAFPMQPLESTI